MRRLASLALLSLATLAAFPLSAHGRWHGPRRVVVEREVCRDTYRRGDDDRWDDRGRAYYHRDYRPYDRDERDRPPVIVWSSAHCPHRSRPAWSSGSTDIRLIRQPVS